MFTGMSSKEVAFQLQFEDPAYFSRIFKKKSGYSPTAFRATMHEKYQQ
jgi:AraC family transcriptional activator of pobA